MELVQNLKDIGASQEDCSVSEVSDENGLIIPDALTGTSALLLARFKIRNESVTSKAGEDYKLLSFSFRCSELEEAGIGSLPEVLLLPHGPDTPDGKEYNRLYLDTGSAAELEGRLCISKGEEFMISCGILVNPKWLSKDSCGQVIAFPEINGGVAFPVSEEDLK